MPIFEYKGLSVSGDVIKARIIEKDGPGFFADKANSEYDEQGLHSLIRSMQAVSDVSEQSLDVLKLAFDRVRTEKFRRSIELAIPEADPTFE